jgi:hypothetical protein
VGRGRRRGGVRRRGHRRQQCGHPPGGIVPGGDRSGVRRDDGGERQGRVLRDAGRGRTNDSVRRGHHRQRLEHGRDSRVDHLRGVQCVDGSGPAAHVRRRRPTRRPRHPGERGPPGVDGNGDDDGRRARDTDGGRRLRDR